MVAAAAVDRIARRRSPAKIRVLARALVTRIRKNVANFLH